MNSKRLLTLEQLFQQGTTLQVSQSTSQNPFFLPSIQETTPYSDTNLSIEDEYKDTFHKLPLELRILYSRIGSQSEYKHPNELIFLSLSDIHKRIQSSPYKHFFDVAIAYAGMGWVHVLAYVPQHSKFFIRMDGGSSGYDRQDNLDKFRDYIPPLQEMTTLEQILKKEFLCD